MTIEEKVGTMLHGNLPSADPLGYSGTGYDLPAVEKLIDGQHLSSFITRLAVKPVIVATRQRRLSSIDEIVLSL